MTDLPPSPTVDDAVGYVMRNVGVIEKSKDSAGKGFKFKYRGIVEVMNALHPIMAEVGLVIYPSKVDYTQEWVDKIKDGRRTDEVERMTTATYEFTVRGPGGDSFTGEVVADAVMARDKSAIAASSYAWRTFACLLFNIPTTDMTDPEEDNTPVAPMRSYDPDTERHRTDDDRAVAKGWGSHAEMVDARDDLMGQLRDVQGEAPTMMAEVKARLMNLGVMTEAGYVVPAFTPEKLAAARRLVTGADFVGIDGQAEPIAQTVATAEAEAATKDKPPTTAKKARPRKAKPKAKP